MSRTMIARYVTPWKFRREQRNERLRALRQRDGDDCRRCRRPLRFDVPEGHDKAPIVQSILASASGEPQAIDDLCLCHRRCHADSIDQTVEVKERIQRRNEAALFSTTRKRAARAG